jgi:lysophospholipid acyltransferase (LPLAT)-like uncharacterized protein
MMASGAAKERDNPSSMQRPLQEAELADVPHRRRRRRLRGMYLRVLTVIAPYLITGALRLLSKTVRIRFTNSEELFACWERGEQVIVAFWHDRVVMMPVAYHGRKLCIMNSQHRDGEIATRALARWGIRSVRGSATRGGAVGFMQLVGAFRDGYDLAVVPDGPRGPRHEAKMGVIHLARATGAPIFPVSYAATRRRQLRTWDGLLIPLPFSRVVFVAGEPLAVPRHTGDDELEAKRFVLEARLNDVTQRAEAEAGI